MEWEFPKPEEDPKYRSDYDATFGEGSFDRDFPKDNAGKGTHPAQHKPTTSFDEYRLKASFFWDYDQSVGVVERKGKFVGVACLAAKKITDAESYVKRFGLQFKKDIHWRGISGLLSHLARSPLFKAVLVTSSNVPFDLKPDIPEDVEGRMRWLDRNFNYHRKTVDILGQDIRKAREGGMFGVPKKLQEREKEESLNASRFLDQKRSDEAQLENRLKRFYQIKGKLFATALLFYVYTTEYNNPQQAHQEIIRKKYATKMEIVQSYFISCVDVEDPEIVFTGFFPTQDRIRTYGGVALSEDAAGFSSDKDVAIALMKMFTTVLELPKEEFQVDEQIHVPGKEVSEEGPRKAFLGYVVRSIVNNQVTKRRVNLPLDSLVRHCLILGTTRSGKSMLAYILIREALATGVKVVVFDPHGSIVNRLRAHPNLKTYRVSGSITNKLREIYDAASQWKETNKLRLLVVLDETSLLKAKNLVDCLNELGKRGVSFCLSTQYSTSIPPPARNVGTYFILSSMTEVEMQRFHEVTLHPSSKLISRLPRATSFVFSPYWVGDPFFVRHRTVS